jgi:hypothetical protein
MKLLDVSLIPPSPPRYGAQRRIQGIIQALSRSHDLTGLARRFLQAGSLFSTQSHERRFFSLPALRRALAGLLSRRRYDIVNVEHDGVTFTSAPTKRAPAPSSLPWDATAKRLQGFFGEILAR